jgi:hypothetical protein
MALENLFPSIGTLAQQTDSQADSIDDNGMAGTPPKEDDDRVVQEIESLCVNCHEQVGTTLPPCYLLTSEELSGRRELHGFS